MKVTVLMDAMTLGLPLAQAFGRIGCLNYGCCHGKVAKSGTKWTVQYQNAESKILRFSPEMRGIKLYPTQIYSAIANAIIYIILVTLFISIEQRPLGMLAAVYLILYAIKRFSIEFFRGEHPRTEWMRLTAWQWISVLIAAAACIFAYYIYVQTSSKVITGSETMQHIDAFSGNRYQNTSFRDGVNTMTDNIVASVLLGLMLTIAYSVHGKKLGKW